MNENEVRTIVETCDKTKVTPSGRLWTCVEPDGHSGTHYMKVAVQPEDLEVEP